MRIGTEITKAQRILQDGATEGADGQIWTRAELLTYFEDGYRHLLAETTATRRFTVLPVPPRVGWSLTYEWERQFCQDAPAFLWAIQVQGGWAASHLWEVELLQGLTPTAAGETTIAHPWERSFVNPTNQHFRFAVPRDSERVVKIWYNHELLIPVSTRSLDREETSWYSLEGSPIAWALGTGGHRTFEVYEIVTNYTADYRQYDAVTNDASTPLYGTARRLTGSRTYAWASDSGDTVPYGMPRRVSSPDRQYLPQTDHAVRNPIGRPMWFASSHDNLLVLEAQIPHATTLKEEDDLALLPAQLGKYVRWYALSRAFNRQGEGYDGGMAALYDQRWSLGIRLMRRLHQVTRLDRQVERAPATPGRRRPPRVRLPSAYPTVLR